MRSLFPARSFLATWLLTAALTAPAMAQQPPVATPPEKKPDAPVRTQCERGDGDCRLFNLQGAGTAGLQLTRTREVESGNNGTRGTVALEGRARLLRLPQRPGGTLVDASVDARSSIDFFDATNSRGSSTELHARGLFAIKGGTAKDLLQAGYYLGVAAEGRSSSSAVIPQEKAIAAGLEGGVVGANFASDLGALLGGYALVGKGRVLGEQDDLRYLDYGLRASFVAGRRVFDLDLGTRKYSDERALNVNHAALAMVWPIHARRGINGQIRMSQETRKRIDSESALFGDLPDRRQTLTIGVTKIFGGSRGTRSGSAK